MHGFGSSPEFLRGLSKWPALADTDGCIVVWPYGVGRSWNAGKNCCQPASKDNIDDVGFLRALIAELIKTDGLDATRVYLSGHSNGCAMAQRFAAEASNLTAAVGCMAFYLLVDAATSYKPVSVMEVHGINDPTVSYQPGQHVGAVANFKKWATLNSCSGSPVETWRQGDNFVQTYKTCKNNTEVSLMTMDKKVGHYPYGGKLAITPDSTKIAVSVHPCPSQDNGRQWWHQFTDGVHHAGEGSKVPQGAVPAIGRVQGDILRVLDFESHRFLLLDRSRKTYASCRDYWREGSSKPTKF